MKDFFRLEGKHAIVIGGAGSVGQVLTRALIACGADVSIASRRIDQLMIAKEKIETEIDTSISVYTVDASNEESIRTLVDTVTKDKGRVDLLLNAPEGDARPGTQDLPMSVIGEMFPVNCIGIAMRQN